MNTADTFKMKILADRQCVAVSAAVLAADKPSLRRLGQGAFNEYANRLSSLMRESIVESDDFGNDFEDVSAEVTSPMRYAHHLINDCGVAVISAQDEEQGIHIKPVEVKFNDRRLVSNIGAYCADGNLETFAARAETQVKSTANELVKANAEARYKAGFDVKITRTGADRCCDWCAERIGSWTIDNAPDGVFGCHDNCKCTVEYRNSKGVTSRRTGRVGSFVEVDYKPHVGVVENGEISPRVLTSGKKSGRMYADLNVDYSKVTEETILNLTPTGVFEGEKGDRYDKARRDLLEHIKKDDDTAGTEYSVIYDRDMKPISGYGIVKGVVGAVKIEDVHELYHALHNHGSNEMLSFKDLYNFSQRLYQLSITATGNRGNNYIFLTEKEDLVSIKKQKAGFLGYLSTQKTKTLFTTSKGQRITFRMFDNVQGIRNIIKSMSGQEVEELWNEVVKKTTECIQVGETKYGFKYYKQNRE